MINPDSHVRTAYVQALKTATGLPVFAKVLPSGSKATQYIILDSQSKSQTVDAKVDYFEWLCRININIYNINPAGIYKPIETDNIEQIVLNTVLPGISIDGFHNKNTDIIESQDLSLEYPTASVDRKLIVFEHWICEK